MFRDGSTSLRHRESSLLENTSNRSDRYILHGMSDSDLPWLHRMFVLIMIANCPDELPSVRCDDLDDLSGRIAFHLLHHLLLIIIRIFLRVYTCANLHFSVCVQVVNPVSEFWHEQAVVGEVELDERNKIVVSQTRMKDKPYVDSLD